MTDQQWPHQQAAWPQQPQQPQQPPAAWPQSPPQQGLVPYGAPQQPYPMAQPYPYPPAPHVVAVAAKDTGIAFLLWFFLGGFGADQFYLGRIGPAVGIVILNLLGWLTIWIFLLGLVFWIPMGIWMIVNACLIPAAVREHNARAFGHLR